MCTYACIVVGEKYMQNVCNIQLSYYLQLEFYKILFELIIHTLKAIGIATIFKVKINPSICVL
jgi:hypothetical protein